MLAIIQPSMDEIKARRARLGYVIPKPPVVPLALVQKPVSPAPQRIEVVIDPTVYEYRVTYRATVKALAKIVASHYGVDLEDMLGPRRTANLTRPRHATYYLARLIFKHKSLPQIGKDMGGRDHTTVLHGVRKMEKMIASNPSLVDEMFYLAHKYKNATAHHVYWGA